MCVDQELQLKTDTFRLCHWFARVQQYQSLGSTGLRLMLNDYHGLLYVFFRFEVLLSWAFN